MTMTTTMTTTGLPQDLKGRTFFVTGANTGIGRATAESLGRRGGRVFLACRSEDKARPVAELIRAAGGTAEILPLDLSDLASVRRCAALFLARNEPLHVLINNAGVGGLRGLTRDGFELAFGTNHIGHFVLTLSILPRLEASGRIVVLSSAAHARAKGIDFDAVRRPTATMTGFPEYSVSKLANLLFAKELARRLGGQGPHSYAVHPGVVGSDIFRSVPRPLMRLAGLFMKSPAEGAETSLFCATSPEVAGDNGRYYDRRREKKPSSIAEDEGLARDLWAKSAEWTGISV